MKPLIFAMALAVSGCGASTPIQYSGTLHGCVTTSGSRTVTSADKPSTMIVDASTMHIAYDGFTGVSQNATNDGGHLTANGALELGCDHDGGCTSAPFTLDLLEDAASVYRGTYEREATPTLVSMKCDATFTEAM